MNYQEIVSLAKEQNINQDNWLHSLCTSAFELARHLSSHLAIPESYKEDDFTYPYVRVIEPLADSSKAKKLSVRDGLPVINGTGEMPFELELTLRHGQFKRLLHIYLGARIAEGHPEYALWDAPGAPQPITKNWTSDISSILVQIKDEIRRCLEKDPSLGNEYGSSVY